MGFKNDTGEIKTEIISQGYTLEKLQKAWKPISPIHNMDNLKDKKILVYLAKKDEIIPFSIGMKYVQGLNQRNYNYRLIVNDRLGHFLTIMYNSFKPRIYLEFLKD